MSPGATGEQVTQIIQNGGLNTKSTERNALETSGDPLVLPPRTPASKFKEFIDRVQKICGPENVFVVEREEQLVDGTYKQPNETHDMHAILDRTYFVCSATIAPLNVP